MSFPAFLQLFYNVSRHDNAVKHIQTYTHMCINMSEE